MSVDLLTEALSSAELAGRDTVVAELPRLYERYVTDVAATPPAALAERSLSRGATLA
jgi:hypothetical protein